MKKTKAKTKARRKAPWSSLRTTKPSPPSVTKPSRTPPELTVRYEGSGLTQACRCCLFWHRFEDDARRYSDAGYCRRYPPERSGPKADLNGVVVSRDAVPPTVSGNNWCGEWKEQQ